MRVHKFIRIFYFFYFFLLVEHIFGTTLETNLAMDGTYRGYAHASFRHSLLSGGFSVRVAKDKNITGACGLNYGIISIGNLNDSGLASEVRNPFSAALGRVEESIFYRANLRALSFSRAGIALKGMNNRLGVAFEKREILTAAVIWGIPFLTDKITTEILTEYGTLEKSSPSKEWYPKKTGHPFGVMGTGAIRIRFHPRYWNLGITAIGSGGTAFRPGWTLAPALIYSKKEWKMRFRAYGASPFFRDTEGQTPPSSIGFSGDIRRNPNQGFLFSISYTGRLGWDDSALLFFGWRFSKISVRMESHWNRVFSNSKEFTTPPLKKIQLLFTWKNKNWNMNLVGSYREKNRWSFFYGISLSAWNRWKFDGGLTLRMESDEWMGDFYLNIETLLGRNRLSFRIQTRNLFGDWETSQLSADRLYIKIKWYMNINKKLTPPTQTNNLFVHNEK